MPRLGVLPTLVRVWCLLLVVALLAGAVHSQADFFEVVSGGSVEDVRIALEAGADVKARDEDTATPLMRAAWQNENPEVVRLLLDAGADLEATDALGGTPLMHTATR